ncbi:MAG: metallophosphoesterase family protein [Methanothrix sp.]|nr:metallophosphoesterase family protein [Methanothrix sp.]
MAGINKKPFRILGLADLHDNRAMLDRFQDIDADVIAFCGDLHNAGCMETARPAAMALARLGPPVLIVPGNMDHKDYAASLWKEAGLHMLDGSYCQMGSVGFIGMGGMVARDPRRLDDPARYYHRDEEVYHTLSKCHREISGAAVRIVLVHQPPCGAQDTLYNGQISGSSGLRRFLEVHQPDLLICGHIHEARGESFVGSCRVVNVGELRQGFAAMIEIGSEISVSWI